MNWKDKKTLSVYDLSNEENKNSGDKNILIETQQSKTSNIYYEKSYCSLSEQEKLIELRTKPSKCLKFSESFNKINLKFYNDNSFPIIFKLKTTQPDIIASQPARGFIQANSFIECDLTSIKINYKILLVVQYAQILNQYDDYITQWKNLKSNQIYIKKFQCIFENKKQIYTKKTLFKPILFTFATITLLTTFIYLRNK
ncbi:unnamed protein product [Rotaria sordida]|uniref:MSP domain-containing protein n=1 Tax=Rotaria sordida TaxID=392033 RepID=A0A815D259_9BILA|nr:unnamed protein product [Rotaria sordida]CAF1214836.1 unnamed protein product [Rotaria sordida]CAF1291847.1 unnamed protein product [Rotaria sordida]CAF1319230.1 unnamed protein product [Rotaria sordida]CAF1321405.1 unnamed protein product [Rotaria sordida]